ncbi:MULTISPECIES: phosphoadenylyl-sulfate reductase [Methanoculleus]|jgi:thioredoxin-dependent adenylylsulfate APS reductase|uniref:phosphoadenylyl-sulfate reductase n=1 Tax=Methanoculleus TaxID=45989 RepID=UPI0025D4AA61|nr:phosphoadenylyl-sulfate reductase [Methanoculleus sp. UBA377]
MARLPETEAKKFAEEFERATPKEVLHWAGEKFKGKIALASSFGLEDVVLIDLIAKSGADIRVFTIDTGRLHQETYTLMERIEEKYSIPVEIFFPDTAAVEAMVNEKGINLFYSSSEARVECCHVRKVEPLRRALAPLDAWVTGLRREQAPTRSGIAKVEIDHVNGGLVKVNPLADWTGDQILAYIKQNDVPYNPLLDQGYVSIGCAACTRPIRKGENPRKGRWWWEDDAKKECGLHLNFSK